MTIEELQPGMAQRPAQEYSEDDKGNQLAMRQPCQHVMRSIEACSHAHSPPVHLLVDDILLLPLENNDTLRPKIARGHQHSYEPRCNVNKFLQITAARSANVEHVRSSHAWTKQ